MTIPTREAEWLEMLVQSLTHIEEVVRGAVGRPLTDYEKRLIAAEKRDAQTLLINLFTGLDCIERRQLAKSDDQA